MSSRVREVMDSHRAPATPDTPIEEVLRGLRANELPGVPVVERGRLVGVVTPVDLLGALAAG
jgi:CBS domain-containing protein